MQISLETDIALPLVEQIVAAIRTHIDDRILRPGMKLPPIRQFATEHGVSRFTVVEAYDRLVALGYLQSRRGSGFYVAARQAESRLESPALPLDRAVDVAWVLRQGLESDARRLKVGSGWLPCDWLDEEGLRRNLRALSRRTDAAIAHYGPPLGYLPLRRLLQVRLAELGIGAGPEQIVLTHGATQALDIAARYLIEPGDCILVDDPGYYNMFGNLRLHGAKLVGVPRDGQGPDPEALEALLRDHQPKAFFTHSVLHNPTADSLSAANAFRVLQLAEKHDFLIVEDDTYSDFHQGGATRLANLDQLKRVIYIGSFSKTLSGSLRVGFLAAHPELAHTLADIKILSCVSTSEFNEQLVYQMLSEGHYRKFIERVNARLTQCQEKSQRMLERRGLEILGEPKHGMFVWARLPEASDAAQLATRAAREDIMLAPGNVFRPQMQASPWLRFNVTAAVDPRLERFLGEALERGD